MFARNHIGFIRISREKVDGVVYEGNDRFEGYSIDLIDDISKILGFRYVFELVPDNAYGSYNKETKKWNGLVKQLLDRVRPLKYNDMHMTELYVIIEGRHGIMRSHHHFIETIGGGFFSAFHDIRCELKIYNFDEGFDHLINYPLYHSPTGISILYAKPVDKPPSLWSFMSPLSLNVWLHMATAYLCVTLALLILSR